MALAYQNQAKRLALRPGSKVNIPGTLRSSRLNGRQAPVRRADRNLAAADGAPTAPDQTRHGQGPRSPRSIQNAGQPSTPRNRLAPETSTDNGRRRPRPGQPRPRRCDLEDGRANTRTRDYAGPVPVLTSADQRDRATSGTGWPWPTSRGFFPAGGGPSLVNSPNYVATTDAGQVRPRPGPRGRKKEPGNQPELQ